MGSLLLRSTLRYTQQRMATTTNMPMGFSASARSSFQSRLITPKELSDALSKRPADNDARIVPVCSSWFLPNDAQGRTGRQAFEQKRIPNSVFFDIDVIKDRSSPYPHMLPTAEVFAEDMSNLGLKRTDRIVVYDTAELGILSAPRVAWTLEVFGHPQVHILNNFKIWVDEGYPIESGKVEETEAKTDYPVPRICPDRIASFRTIKSAIRQPKDDEDEKIQILDLRSPGRFSGKDPEPRPSISSGHIPGSINIPLDMILDPQSRAFLPAEQLRKVFEKAGLSEQIPIISSCGTGVMACALDVALGEAQFGNDLDRQVYDGSWTEYAQRAKEDGMIVKDI